MWLHHFFREIVITCWRNRYHGNWIDFRELHLFLMSFITFRYPLPEYKFMKVLLWSVTKYLYFCEVFSTQVEENAVMQFTRSCGRTVLIEGFPPAQSLRIPAVEGSDDNCGICQNWTTLLPMTDSVDCRNIIVIIVVSSLPSQAKRSYTIIHQSMPTA